MPRPTLATPAAVPIEPQRLWLATVATVAIFSFFFYFNAYVCDDAFIVFRAVDNFIRGDGLRPRCSSGSA